MYDEEQFRCRFRFPNDSFWEMFQIIEADITADNVRGNPSPAEIRLLLKLRLYTTGAFHEAYADLCDNISQRSASRINRHVTQAIAWLKICYIQFPTAEMLQ